MRRWLAMSMAAILLLGVGCADKNDNNAADKNGIETETTTEQTTSAVDVPPLSATAETLTAYGQILNNACVYLNENYDSKIKGDVRKRYDELRDKLHNINLKGINTYAAMSEEERNEVFSQLEEIENGLFDDVADKIGIKAELTEAITTTADKKADLKAKSEVITTSQEETAAAAESADPDSETTTGSEHERITAAD